MFLDNFQSEVFWPCSNPRSGSQWRCSGILYPTWLPPFPVRLWEGWGRISRPCWMASSGSHCFGYTRWKRKERLTIIQTSDDPSNGMTRGRVCEVTWHTSVLFKRISDLCVTRTALLSDQSNCTRCCDEPNHFRSWLQFYFISFSNVLIHINKLNFLSLLRLM